MKSIIITGLAIVFAVSAHAQPLEGYVNSSESYPRPAVSQAIVSAGELGSTLTNWEGYYELPSSGLPPAPPGAIAPMPRPALKFVISNILGQEVGEFGENENYNGFFMTNRQLAAGPYFLSCVDGGNNLLYTQKIMFSGGMSLVGRENFVNRQMMFNFRNNYSDVNLTKGEVSVDDPAVEYVFRAARLGYYTYQDTVEVEGVTEKDVRLFPDIETNSPYYPEFLDLMKDLEKSIFNPDPNSGVLENYGEYPNSEWAPYPQRIWLNAHGAWGAYQCCQEPELYLNTLPIVVDSINTKMERKGLTVDVFTIVEDSIDANIWLNYRYGNGSIFGARYENSNLIGGILYFKNNFPSPPWIIREGYHEFAFSLLGMEGRSIDPNHVSHIPAQALEIAPIEEEAVVNHILQDNLTYMRNHIGE